MSVQYPHGRSTTWPTHSLNGSVKSSISFQLPSSSAGFPPTLREIGEHFAHPLDERRERPPEGAREEGPPPSRGPQVARDAAGLSRRHRRDRPAGEPPAGARAPATSSWSADDDDMAEIPILGRVAAGMPILAVENATDTVRVDRILIGGHREVFGLRIVGESMIEDGIFDGDYVFVKKTPTANSGDIVVAMIEGEATVKRYFPEGDKIRFQPANSEHDARSSSAEPTSNPSISSASWSASTASCEVSRSGRLTISGNGFAVWLCQTESRWHVRAHIAAAGCGSPRWPCPGSRRALRSSPTR